MSTLFSLVFVIALVCAVIFLVMWLLQRRKNKKADLNKFWIALVCALVGFIGYQFTAPSDSSSHSSAKTEQSKSSKSKPKKKSSSSSSSEEASSDDDDADDASIPAPKSYQDTTYDTLARYPDKVKGKGVKISGTVLQAEAEGSDLDLLVNIDDDPDQIVMVYVPKEQKPSGEILEEDSVVIKGAAEDKTSYKTVQGDKRSVPFIAATAKVEDSGKSSDDDY